MLDLGPRAVENRKWAGVDMQFFRWYSVLRIASRTKVHIKLMAHGEGLYTSRNADTTLSCSSHRFKAYAGCNTTIVGRF